MAWICKIAQLHCSAVSMRFEVSRLFSRYTIDLQIKLFLRSGSLSLHLLHVCCVLKLIAQCFCCLLHYIYWVLCTALVIYYFSVQFWRRNFIASSSSNSNVCFQLAAELSLWSKKWEKQFKLNRPENVFIIFLTAARMLSRLSESALMTREREERESVGWLKFEMISFSIFEVERQKIFIHATCFVILLLAGQSEPNHLFILLPSF